MSKRICLQCGKAFEKYFDAKYCDKSCAAKHRWQQHGKHRAFSGHGYTMVPAPEGHPRASVRNRVPKHVLVAEQSMGRFLEPDEVVHHINYIIEDNSPRNLYVCVDRREHAFIHRMTRWLLYEFLKERRLGGAFADYVWGRFLSKYESGGFEDYLDAPNREVFGHFFPEGPVGIDGTYGPQN